MIKLASIGFGTVGQSFTKILHDKKQMLKDRYDLETKLVAISDVMKGSVMDKDGLDMTELLRLVSETGKIDDYDGGVKGLDSVETINQCGADVMVEMAWTDLETGEPNITHMKEALNAGAHVITSNKGPIALAYKELVELAKKNGVQIRYECTVMSGTPVLSMAQENLTGHVINSVKGIVNGTTNYILTKMENGGSYDVALKEAQELGYAEAEPSADVDGWDAVGKTVIMANALMGASLKPGDVEREGITGITLNDIMEAKIQGKHIKLIAHAWREGDEVKAKVSPEMVDEDDPLASVKGTVNAITLTTDGLGDVTIIGRGAGGTETGHGILSDLLAIHRSRK
ncbi:MAG: homoserine dehydrogenase [Candidatus Bathyarchaeota archaeon]|nr:homoserine dehydrogenase [Candidatus Bathyarchaeota archaeon]